MKHKIDEARMVILIETSDDEGNEVVHELPFIFDVCSRCGGKGMHMNPSIGECAITQEEWEYEWSEEEKDAYLHGGYDITCLDCGGRRVVPTPDRNRARRECPKALEAFDEIVKDEREYQALVRMEQRMGA